MAKFVLEFRLWVVKKSANPQAKMSQGVELKTSINELTEKMSLDFNLIY
jgi:hypothetical protein